MSVNSIFKPDRTYAFCSYPFWRFYFINPQNGFRTTVTAIRTERVWKSYPQFDVRIGPDRLCGILASGSVPVNRNETFESEYMQLLKKKIVLTIIAIYEQKDFPITMYFISLQNERMAYSFY